MKICSGGNLFMCLAMYLFTYNNIDEREYDIENPKMFIKKMSLKNEMSYDVVGTLKWNEHNGKIYYIGSYEGCGCGWSSIKPCSYGKINKDEAKQKLYKKIIDRRILYTLLKSNNYNGSYIIVCWEGDQGKEITKTTNISIEKIKKTNYEFFELVKYILRE